MERPPPICTRNYTLLPYTTLFRSQEALIAIGRGLGRFDGRAAFTTWAHRVATNACLDELRRRGRRPTPGLPFDDAAGEGGLAPRSSPGVDAVPERLAVDRKSTRLNSRH